MSIRIEVKGSELFDYETERFIEVKPTVLILEHSLIAVSKWESKYHVPFLRENEKTEEQLEYYFRCMTINNVDPNVYKGLTYSQQEEILNYIKDPMTATWFGDKNDKRGGRGQSPDVITSELIYYWMTAFNIPSEYEKWHLNRLMTLIRICEEYNDTSSKKTKRSVNEIARSNDAINAARRAKMKTRG